MAEPLPLTVVGLDHHRTPVAVRERLALPPERVPAVIGELRARVGAGEAVVLSTCNRLECYLTGPHEPAGTAAILAGLGGLSVEAVLDHAYIHRGTESVRHLFRVASGLESLVIGEEQIIAQVKQAYETAHASGWTGTLLNPLFQRALGVAKDVRTNTALAKHKLSVASVAVDLARQIHGDLARARLLILGAGEMAELAVRYLVDHGVRQISVVNRSQERALDLVGHLAGAQVFPWTDLGKALAQADIVVASTAAPHAVVQVEDVRAAMHRRREPLVLIDLAVPRDIEPAVGELDDVYVYNIDHLEKVVGANRQLRLDEVQAAEARVEDHIRAYVALAKPDTAQLLTDVGRFFAGVVDAEAQRLSEKLHLEPATAGEVRYGIERAANKLTHRVHAYLRAHPGDPEAERMIRELLGLERSDPR
jgi:glutamyl-tRNA reductase